MTAVKGNDVGQPVFEVRFIVVTTLVMEDASVVAVAALAKFRVDITAPYQPVPVKVTRPEPEIVSVKSAAVLEMVPPKSQYAMTGLVAALPGVHVVGPAHWGEDWSPAAHHDPDRDELAHIPYTRAGYAVLATAVA